MILQHSLSVPLAFLGGHPLLFGVAAWACVAVAAWALLMGCMNRLLMKKLYGPARYHACHAATWLLGMQAKRIRTLAFLKWICAIIGVYGIVRHFESNPSPFQTFGGSLVYAILLLVGCVQFFGQERPAAILLLGACQEATLRLHAGLRDAAFPHRVVSLLETKDIRSQNINAGDCFRITFGKWERAISRFIRCCIIVVVDGRVVTPAVSHELKEIVEQRVQFKTVLIGHPENSALDEELALCSHVNSEDECAALLKRVFNERMTLPSDAEPLSSLAG